MVKIQRSWKGFSAVGIAAALAFALGSCLVRTWAADDTSTTTTNAKTTTAATKNVQAGRQSRQSEEKLRRQEARYQPENRHHAKAVLYAPESHSRVSPRDDCRALPSAREAHEARAFDPT